MLNKRQRAKTSMARAIEATAHDWLSGLGDGWDLDEGAVIATPPADEHIMLALHELDEAGDAMPDPLIRLRVRVVIEEVI